MRVVHSAGVLRDVLPELALQGRVHCVAACIRRSGRALWQTKHVPHLQAARKGAGAAPGELATPVGTRFAALERTSAAWLPVYRSTTLRAPSPYASHSCARSWSLDIGPWTCVGARQGLSRLLATHAAAEAREVPSGDAHYSGASWSAVRVPPDASERPDRACLLLCSACCSALQFIDMRDLPSLARMQARPHNTRGSMHAPRQFERSRSECLRAAASTSVRALPSRMMRNVPGCERSTTVEPRRSSGSRPPSKTHPHCADVSARRHTTHRQGAPFPTAH